MLIQGIPFQEVMDTLTQGVKGAVPAVMLLALAYSINSLSKTMGTAGLYYFHERRIPDTGSASGDHLCDFRDHGICNRVPHGEHLQSVMPIALPLALPLQVCELGDARLCMLWSSSRRRCIRRSQFTAVRYDRTFIYRFCI